MAYFTKGRASPPTINRTSWVLYVAWLCGASFLFLLFVEMTCRWLGFAPMGTLEPADCLSGSEYTCSEGSWTKGPQWISGAGTFHLNRAGDRAPERLPQGCRVPILFLGDSFTFGHYLPQEKAFPQVIARKLADRPELCVYNGGRVGGTLEVEQKRFRALREWLNATPKVLVHQFFGDDVYQHANAINELVEKFFRERLGLIGIGLASVRLQLALAWHFQWARRGLERQRFARDLPRSSYDQMMAGYRADWAEWMDEIERTGMERVELVIPFPAAMASERVEHLDPLLSAAAARGIPTLLLTRRNLPHDPLLFNDLHFDGATNERIAELLLPYILDAVNRVQAPLAQESGL